MLAAKSVSSSMASTVKLSSFTGAPFSDPTLYRNTTSSLQYLSFTRSDISYTVGKAWQFMYSPSTDHWSAVNGILQFPWLLFTVLSKLSPASSNNSTLGGGHLDSTHSALTFRGHSRLYTTTTCVTYQKQRVSPIKNMLFFFYILKVFFLNLNLVYFFNFKLIFF